MSTTESTPGAMPQGSTAGPTEPDMARLEAQVFQAVTDIGAALNGALVILGVDLGFWSALGDGHPMSAADLAERCSVPEPYANQWLSAQAASGYIGTDLDRESGEVMFQMSPEQAMVFCDPDSPVYMAGGFHIVRSVYEDLPRIQQAMADGHGFGWHEHDAELFLGTEQFFRPGYRMHLIDEWLPALDGVHEALTAGAKVADVGCGHGVSTAVMAKHYPASTFVGFDYHQASIDRASALAQEEGVEANTTFARAKADDYPGSDYDLICFFDCLHDMGDPIGALQHARAALAPGGTVMLVEPRAGDTLAENLNPVGRVFYAASTMICTPSSLAQDVGAALGAQAGEARLRHVAESAGFTHVRRAMETPVNMVIELRP
ncbi:MAG: methyltransferase domain-containing protein [Nocardioides sp.]|uniref:methyltransferase domain-containing protein n=1 Tax=Nocardioides nematodiphilus TaxID=2849669 RepID=UPI001CD939FE|nr:methyltransferase domain-containing protein [Nocardioides nematodiphilus]MCA1982655.1 class I SAM-dependent methyltransferase [Nocardioides nematodiphilus]